MPILDEIEAFFAGQPNWQRRIYETLRAGTEVNDQLLCELTEECVREASEKAKAKNLVSSAVALPIVDVLPTVRLVRLENVQRICSLAPDQSLAFAPDGLTVVYGDNGAGKTGYGRILRQVCRARGITPVLRGNVFLDVQPAGSADVSFSVDGVEDRIAVKAGEVGDGPLRRFSIFDTGAAASLVNEENAAAFRPFGLDLLDRYTGVADKIKGRIEGELSQTETPWIRMEDFLETTAPGRLVRDLASASVRKTLGSHMHMLAPEKENRRQELKKIIAQAKANDPAKLSKATNSKATRYQQFTERLKGIATAFSAADIELFVALRKETHEIETAAEIARTKAFSEESLMDVGAAT